jgi:hypothetical protein
MSPSLITQSVLADHRQPAPRVQRAAARRLNPRELHISVEFSRAATESTTVEVSLGYLCIEERELRSYTIALSLPQPLWKSGWPSRIVEPEWNEERTGFQVTLTLPEKFERIPEAPDVVCSPPEDAPWPFMSSERWRELTDPWG